MNSNTQIQDRMVNRAAMMRLHERRIHEKVGVVLDGHEKRLDSVILAGGTRKQLMDAVDKELLRTYKEAHSVSSRSLLDLFVDQSSFVYQTVEAAMSEIWRTKRPERRLAEQVVLERPLYQNKTLLQGWAGVSLAERKRLESVIRRGIANGDTVERIALEVRRGNVHKITRMQSQALVITAMTSVSTQADFAVYKANERALTGWQYVAVLDDRTTALCASRDGKVYPMDDEEHRPPAHWRCRSTTTPVFKSWADIAKLEGAAQVRKRNLSKLTDKQRAFYDGQTPLRETYQEWLARQPQEIQLRHLGDYEAVTAFQRGKLQLDKFTNPAGNSIGIEDLRKLSEYDPPQDTHRFAAAKARLDAIQLGASRVDDFLESPELRRNLVEYYKLQSGDLDGNLSITNYRGVVLAAKRNSKRAVLRSPPREDQLRFNPFTQRYEDVRVYQPQPAVFAARMRLVDLSEDLLDGDKKFIHDVVDDLKGTMSMNERAAVADNLRVVFGRQRRSGEVWGNFKAVANSQLKFDVMNISDSIETFLRRDTDFLKKLAQEAYIDPVLGPTSLDEISKNFIANIRAKNRWTDSTMPKIAREMRGMFGSSIVRKVLGQGQLNMARKHPLIWKRLSEKDWERFYMRFIQRLSLADAPDRDMLAMELGRDLYNSASLNGDRNQWYALGMDYLNAPQAKKLYVIETFGVQKRRLKSRLSNKYFGPYYDTLSYNVRVVDKRILEYARLNRAVDLGLRTAIVDDKRRLVIRPGYKTYFIDDGILGYTDTRLPITSTSAFREFPANFVDDDMAAALNWATQSKYRIDPDYHRFIRGLLDFQDDRGMAKHYNELNEYREYMASRGDAYERFKSMEWLLKGNKAFSNHAFIDHRARIYDHGLISPQSGETFRPFLNTAVSRKFSAEGFVNLQDQIGAFLGGLNDEFEGRYNGLTFTGRQKIAAKWRPELVKIGNHMLRGKPGDYRAILDSRMVQQIEGEDLGKFYRFAIESAKLDAYLGGDYSKRSLDRLSAYDMALALEQDASSSGAQIIALTTRNKQLAELSNVIPTTQKKRLYDEIAHSTYNDPRFRALNEKFGLTEKDLRKAAKAQNMVSFYGAGERTGILNVEAKLGKALGKQEGTLVVTAAERDRIVDQITAQMAKYEKFDVDTAKELRVLRQNVKDALNKGRPLGDDILEQLWFLDPKTKDLVDKMTMQYERVVTPDDFKAIAKIMSEHLGEQVPVLKSFTRFFGRLAEDYLKHAKPSSSEIDWSKALLTQLRGNKKKGYTLPKWLSEILGLKPDEPLSEKMMKRWGWYRPDGTLSQVIYGVDTPKNRQTGRRLFKLEMKVPAVDLKKGTFGKDVTLAQLNLLQPAKLPKSWTNVPWVNFDGKVLEQNFTQTFEERLVYRDAKGNTVMNILNVPQKTQLSTWDEMTGADGKIMDIADVMKARTAFGVNGNHSNDAVIVKRFHLWGKKHGVTTSTIHDAFFANAADMVPARKALREVYAEMTTKNVIINILNEMEARGFPKQLKKKYLQEAIDEGLIPVAGKSVIGGRIVTADDILKMEDVLKQIPDGFENDYGWYGVG